jgi:hypothetical protein
LPRSDLFTAHLAALDQCFRQTLYLRAVFVHKGSGAPRIRFAKAIVVRSRPIPYAVGSIEKTIANRLQ